MGAPVGHTCPDINEAIQSLKEIEAHTYHVNSILEGLRKDNEALREWGYSLEEKVNNLEKEITKLEELSLIHI